MLTGSRIRTTIGVIATAALIAMLAAPASGRPTARAVPTPWGGKGRPLARGCRSIRTGSRPGAGGRSFGIAPPGRTEEGRRVQTPSRYSVNTASRLCGLAKSTEILASENTVRRAGPGFLIEPVSVLQVKGKEKGVNTFRVVGLST